MRTFTKIEVLQHVRAELLKSYGQMSEEPGFAYGVIGVVTAALPDEPVQPKTIDENREIADRIKTVVCAYFKLSPADIESKNRPDGIVLPRQVGMYFTEKMTSLTLKQIGVMYGGKDHSTVIYSRNLIRLQKETDFEIRKSVREIEKLLADPTGPLNGEQERGEVLVIKHN